jgi:DNA topoisomerase-2
MPGQKRYRRSDLHEHMLRAPETYIGAPLPVSRREYLVRNGRIVHEDVTYVPAVLKLFEELVSNAADNGLHSPPPLPPVHISVADGVVRVANGGLPITIEFDDEEGMYVPELIFGNLLTSSHYDETESNAGGKNGYGAKAVNVFSESFEVDLRDGRRRYQQRWTGNMYHKEPPVITDDTGLPRVEVSYRMDFARFGLDPVAGYGDPYEALMERVALDYAFNCRQATVFNGRTYDAMTAREYALLLDVGARPHVHYVSEERTSTGMHVIEFAVAAVEGEAAPISFANGICTYAGGCHVDLVMARTVAALRTAWGVPIGDARRHLLLIVAVSVNRPVFRSQAKDFLNGPNPALSPVPAFYFRDLGLDEGLRQHASLLKLPKVQLPSSDETDAVVGLTDALYAGQRNRARCTLIIVEGPSAEPYATNYISHQPDQRLYYGVQVDQGVVINACFDCEIVKNHSAVRRLRRALGPPENPRYGRVILMSDADPDGYHINLLKLYMIHRFYPRLLEEGRVYLYVSPLLRASVPGDPQQYHFQSISQYEEFSRTHPQATARYLKGLGSSEPEDIARDAALNPLTQLEVDPQMERTMRIFFSPFQRVLRREILEGLDMRQLPEPLGPVPRRTVTSYFLTEGVLFAMTANRRAIPAIDGLKLTYRKIYWGALNEFSKQKNPARGLQETLTRVKVGYLGGLVSNNVGYDNGEQFMDNCIVRAASESTNNYPLLRALGQFSTLERGIRGATKPRYLHTAPSELLTAVFPPRDTPQLSITHGHGTKNGEPDLMLPVIPLSLLNGIRSIGCCWSSFIPRHRAADLVNWLRQRMDGETPTPARLEYRHNPLTTVHLRARKGRLCASDSDEDLSEAETLYMESQGAWELVRRQGPHCVDIHISSLPVDVLLVDYRRTLERLQALGVIERFQHRSVLDVNIYVYGVVLRTQFFSPAEKRHHPKNLNDLPIKLGLRSYRKLGNMHVISPMGNIVKYRTPCALLEDFYKWRLPFYDRLAQLELDKVREEHQRLAHRRRFVQACVDGEITIVGVSRQEQRAQITRLGLPHTIAKECDLETLTIDEVGRLEEKMRKLDEKLTQQEAINGKHLWKDDLSNFLQALEKTPRAIN